MQSYNIEHDTKKRKPKVPQKGTKYKCKDNNL